EGEEALVRVLPEDADAGVPRPRLGEEGVRPAPRLGERGQVDISETEEGADGRLRVRTVCLPVECPAVLALGEAHPPDADSSAVRAVGVARPAEDLAAPKCRGEVEVTVP